MIAPAQLPFGEMPAFDALFNFRDLGGYDTVDGGRTKHGRVFRSDGLHRCSPDDVKRLEQLGLARVIDLRTARERTHDGCFDALHPTIDYHHVPVLDEVRGIAGASAEEAAAARRAALARLLEAGVPPLLDTYRRVLSRRGYRLVEVIELIVSAPGPVAFHCTAGKDRTGLVAALVLSLVGVPDELVVDDYARSRHAMDKLVAWYRAHRDGDTTGANITDERANALLGAEPEWMHTVLDELRAQYGSVRDYVLAMGATESTIDRLQATLVD